MSMIIRKYLHVLLSATSNNAQVSMLDLRHMKGLDIDFMVSDIIGCCFNIKL